MNLIESLQIEKPYMTSDTTCIAKMNLGIPQTAPRLSKRWSHLGIC